MPPTSPMVIGIVLSAIGFIVTGGLLIVAFRRRHVDADTSMGDLTLFARPIRRPHPHPPAPVPAAFSHSRTHDDRLRQLEERSG